MSKSLKKQIKLYRNISFCVSLLSVFLILFLSVFMPSISLRAFASSSSLSPISHGNSTDSYEIDNFTPDGNFYFFYRCSEPDKYDYYPISQMSKNVLLKLGIVCNTSVFDSFLSFCQGAYLNVKSITSDSIYPVYGSDGSTCIGYAEADCLGLDYIDSHPEEITLSNDVMNGFYLLWNEADLDVIDFFYYPVTTMDWMKSNFTFQAPTFLNYYTAVASVYDGFMATPQVNGSAAANNNFYIFNPSVDSYLVASNQTLYDSFCNYLNIDSNGSYISDYDSLRGYTHFDCALYYFDDNFVVQGDFKSKYVYSSSSPYYTVGTENNLTVKLGKNQYPFYIVNNSVGLVPVYRNLNIVNSIVDKTYRPSVMTTNTYNNYNTSADNSNTYTTTSFNNISNNYNTVYDNASTNYNDFYTSNVTNNYYDFDMSALITFLGGLIDDLVDIGGDDGGVGGLIPSPDTPNWPTFPQVSALGDMIASWFTAIGTVLTAVVDGIDGLVTDLIHLFTDLPRAFSGYTDFLQDFFYFLPNEFIDTVVAALSIMLLVAVIKFIM